MSTTQAAAKKYNCIYEGVNKAKVVIGKSNKKSRKKNTDWLRRYSRVSSPVRKSEPKNAIKPIRATRNAKTLSNKAPNSCTVVKANGRYIARLK